MEDIGLDKGVAAVYKRIIDDVIRILQLKVDIQSLTEIKQATIGTPIGNILDKLNLYLSPLNTQTVDFELLSTVLARLNRTKSILRLNHVGFCYKSTNNQKEKEVLIKLVNKTRFHLYEENSNDDGLWLFIGNTEKWQEPMIELLPVESTTDKWAPYWLPHIQVDIDSRLDAGEIRSIIYDVYGLSRTPHPIIINGVTYILRLWLGTENGVNFYLDISTKARNTKIHRLNNLKKLT